MRLFRTKRSDPKPRRQRRTLRLERLHERRLLAADIDLADGELIVEGTNYDDVIEVAYERNHDGSLDYDEIEAIVKDANGGVLEREDFDADKVDRIVVRALDGNDRVENSTGVTSFQYGGDGHDLLIGSDPVNLPDTSLDPAGVDYLMGNSGRDRLFGRGGSDALKGGYGDDDLYGGRGDDDLYGYRGDDYLRGGRGDDYLSGYSGDDRLYGDNGHDRLSGSYGHDRLYGGRHSDWLYGGYGNDVLDGGGHYDRLYGQGGHDVLRGGTQDDWLYGGYGYDRLYGGHGGDYLDGGADRYSDLLDGDDESRYGRYRDTFVIHLGATSESLNDYGFEDRFVFA